MNEATNRLSERALALLREAPSFEVMALIPSCLPAGAGELVLPRSRFHRYPVLGTVAVVDRALRDEITSAVAHGIEEPALVANCFIPRHGIRAADVEDGIELVICFECGQLHASVIKPNPEQARWLTISTSPKPVLDRVLLEAGVPLGPTEIQRAEVIRALDAEMAEAERIREANRLATQVVIPAIDPERPRHGQFFQFVCPACKQADHVGLWFTFKTCSGCGKGWRLVRQPT